MATVRSGWWTLRFDDDLRESLLMAIRGRPPMSAPRTELLDAARTAVLQDEGRSSLAGHSEVEHDVRDCIRYESAPAVGALVEAISARASLDPGAAELRSSLDQVLTSAGVELDLDTSGTGLA